MSRNNLTEQEKGYYTLQVHGRTHILVENNNRELVPCDYMRTGMALKGVCKPNETFQDWKQNRKIL